MGEGQTREGLPSPVLFLLLPVLDMISAEAKRIGQCVNGSTLPLPASFLCTWLLIYLLIM